jgi:hypothetical protein
VTVNSTVQTLSEAELAIIRETEKDRLDALDEDELLDVHARVRRARNKYMKLYRRQASARVEDLGGRGFARAKNARNIAKAEVFEDALARVSRRLSAAARESANKLKAERLAAARADAVLPGATATGRAAKKTTAATPTKTASAKRSGAPAAKSPGTRKRHASTLAMGARRQARKDSRGKAAGS